MRATLSRDSSIMAYCVAHEYLTNRIISLPRCVVKDHEKELPFLVFGYRGSNVANTFANRIAARECIKSYI